LDKRVFLITGPPGVGKTTVFGKIMVAINAQGYRVGGIMSREIRQDNQRIGFEIIDLTTLRRGWLAHVTQETGPQIGKYRVNLENLDGIGAHAIVKATETCEIVAIDEIGPMELFSQKFKEAVEKALSSQKLVIATTHWREQDNLIRETRNREDAEAIITSHENREKLSETIVEKALSFLNRSTLGKTSSSP